MQIDISGFLTQAQEVQESIMLDQILIEQPGEQVFSEEEMKDVTGPSVPLWWSKGLVQAAKTQTATGVVAGQVVGVQGYKGKVPLQVQVEKGMLVTVLQSHDPWMVDRTFVVGTVYGSSMATCRYFELEDRDNDGR